MSRTTKTFNQVMLVALATSAGLMVTGCGKNSSDASKEKPAASAPVKTHTFTPAPAPVVKPAAGDADEKFTLKLNAYTEAYNRLIDNSFGLAAMRKRYFEQNIPQKSATDSITINDGVVSVSFNQFQKARALPSASLDELDQVADQLMIPMNKLVTQLKALNIYYTSKAYKEDNLAKGKAQDAEVRANFDATTAATEKFNAVLSREQKKRNVQMLAKLKAEGNLLGYGTKLALQQGDELLSLFAGENDIKNPEKYQQADALVLELEKTLTEQRAQYAAAQTKTPHPDSWHESAASYLTAMIGSYREMKQSKKPKDFNEIVNNYNKAVENANRIRH